MKINHSLKLGPNLLVQAEESLKNILSQLPNATFELKPDQGGVDFLGSLRTQNGLLRLAVQVRSRARPDELNWFSEKFSFLERVHGTSFIPILVAPYVSAAAADKCQELGLNWVDFAGNCEIRLTNSFIKVRGMKNPFIEKRGTASLFTPASSRVAHALLLNPNRKWKIEELAARSTVSTGQVSNVRRLLSELDWIDAGYGGITLKQPEKLLLDWEEHYRPKRRVERFFTLESFGELEARLQENLQKYAVTEFAAVEQYAPHTRFQKIAFYTSDNWNSDLADELHLRPGEGATNVTVYLTDEGLTFSEEPNLVVCSSPIITYLDLKLITGRGQDAAEFLLDRVIRKRWQ